MPRVMEKEDLLKNVVDASRLNRFWFDTIRPSSEQTLVKFPESLVGYDIQVVYVPVKRPARKSSSGLDLFNALRDHGPILEDSEMSVFDRVKDFGREVELA